MDKRALIELARTNPVVKKGVEAIRAQLGSQPIMADDLRQIISLLEHVLNNPTSYQQVRAEAIQRGLINPSNLPAQFNPQLIIVLLIAFYGLHDNLSQHKATGGLAGAARKLQESGRYGDTMLAHINPQEAQMLKQAGGSGTINPKTGLPEFFKLSDILSAVVPIATDYILPGLSKSISDFIPSSIGDLIPGGSKALGSILGGAGIGAVTSSLTGGNALQGGILGSLQGGLGNVVSDVVGSALPFDWGSQIGQTGRSLLSGALLGAASNALQGKNALSGAGMGAAGGALSGAAKDTGNFGQSGALGKGLGSGATAIGNMLTAGYNPTEAVTSGGLTGLASGLMYKPSDAAVKNVKDANSTAFKDKMANIGFGSSDTSGGSGESSSPFNMSNALKIGALGLVGSQLLGNNGLFGGSSNQATTSTTQPTALSANQQELFSRPSQTLDWSKLQDEAARSGLSLQQYMARNWNRIGGGQYYIPTTTPQMAKGGALSNISYLAQGAGSGRDDTIDARLSDGEFVIDAETVALLGDGSNKEGARKLNQMRSEIRKQKGKKLVKGDISINAKSPLSYIKKGAK